MEAGDSKDTVDNSSPQPNTTILPSQVRCNWYTDPPSTRAVWRGICGTKEQLEDRCREVAAQAGFTRVAIRLTPYNTTRVNGQKAPIDRHITADLGNPGSDMWSPCKIYTVGHPHPDSALLSVPNNPELFAAVEGGNFGSNTKVAPEF